MSVCTNSHSFLLAKEICSCQSVLYLHYLPNIEEEEIYFSKQKHSVQSVVCLNTIISNNKKYYVTVLKNMYFKYSDIVNDFI